MKGQRTRKHPSFLRLWFLSFVALTTSLKPAAPPVNRMRSRRGFLTAAGGLVSAACLALSSAPRAANALAFQQQPKNLPQTTATVEINGEFQAQPTIAYKQLSLKVREHGVDVPVAAWFPVSNEEKNRVTATAGAGTSLKPATYRHRISVRRIGQLLARWDFIPGFVSRGYNMAPCSTTAQVVDGSELGLPTATTTEAPVVLLAHGFLGSRFDLSHLAEELASHGFVCIAPEYPESLAASYERAEGLDRRAINDALLDALAQEWKIQASAYGIVGHSLGCGTVAQTGDASWARVSIAGFPTNADATRSGLLLASMNDGAVSIARRGGRSLISSANYEMLDETALAASALLPRRAALVFDRPDAPNHISFLAEGVNDAMIELLSPLLPVAQTMGIPVLDFDRYQISRDSKATAAVVLPLVVQYLKQEMKTTQR